MPIANPNPVVVPATTAKTFDKVFISSLNIMTPDPNGKSSANIAIRPARLLEDDTMELGPETGLGFIRIADLYEEAAKRPKLAAAMAAVMAAVEDIVANPGE